ncbi:MAG TPA: immunoglobulin domain-containing protein [Verrucomicrobiae bacterium]|nr:immunoglobulin domain-containing protein [Verrucomicrobiae bacterium]
MKRLLYSLRLLLAAAVVGLCLDSRGAQLVLEQFNQAVADNSPIGLATSWHAISYETAGGVVTDYTLSTPNGNYPTISRANNGGFGGVTGNTVMATFGFSTPSLFWTNAGPALQDSAISNIVFFTKNNANTSTERVVVQIAGQWYAATNIFRDNGGNSVWASNYFAFTREATSWQMLDTNTLTLGATLSNPLPEGNIEAVGLYGIVPVSGKIRMDQFSVNGTPPAAPVVGEPIASPAANVTAPTTLTLEASVFGVPAVSSLQWRKGGIALNNGPSGSGSTLAGATSGQLVITSTSPADSGDYDLIASNSYGATTSAVVVVTVTASAIPPSIASIDTVPVNGISEVGGAPMSITVTASGTGPFTYQWQKGGVPILNETNDVLTLASTFANAGNYAVAVSSAYGSITSAPPTTLTVVDTTAPVITFPLGNTTNIALNAAFSPAYAATDNSGETPGVAISGSVNTSVAGSYAVTVTAWDSALNTNTAVLTVNVWLLNENFDETLADNAAVSAVPGWHASAIATASGQVIDYTTVGGNANFPTISRSATAPGAIDGAPGFLVMGDALNATPSLVWKDTTTILQNQQVTNITFFSRNNSASSVTYVAIRIHTNWYVSSQGFTDTTAGAVPWAAHNFEFNYDASSWQLLDAATLTIIGPVSEPLPNLSISALGFYGVMAAGKIRIDALHVSGKPAAFPPTPPSVSEPLVSPLNRVDNTAWTGTPVTFSATAAGTPPLSYQWRKDGVAIAVTTNVWTLVNPTTSDSGEYDLVVSNPGGSVTSSVVNLTVSSARLFVDQQFNQSTNDPGVIGQVPGWHVLALNLTNLTVTDYTFEPNPPASLNFPNLSRGPGADGAIGYMVMGQGDTVNPVLAWMETPPQLQSGFITNVQFHTRNSFSSSTLQVAVQIGGQWYVSTTSMQDFGGGLVWMPQNFVFTSDAGAWQALDITTLALGDFTVEPLPNQPVTGIGLFGNMYGVATARLRVDGFQVDGFTSLATSPSIQRVYVSGGNLVLRTGTESGRNYVLEATPNLQTPGWTAIATNAGTGGTITNLVPVKPASASEFFRYRIQ